jgi:hypothetical protein
MTQNRLGIAALAIILGLNGAPARAGFTFITPSGSSTTDGPVNAQAIFDVSNNQVKVTLTNFQANPTADGQLISGISFTVAGASGSGSLTTANNGLISTINTSNGTYTTPGTSDPLTRWTATETGTSIDLTTLSGGSPNRLIIGPDSAGGFSGAGLYSNANASINNRNPSVLGTATFIITVPGVTTPGPQDMPISNVVFEFGTGPSRVTAQAAVPEPTSIVMAGTGFGMAGLYVLRRRRALRRRVGVA